MRIFLAFLFFVTSAVVAQIPKPPANFLPSEHSEPTATPSTSPTPEGGSSPHVGGVNGSDDEMVTIQLPSNPIGDVMNLYETLSGKRLIRDSNLEGPPLSIMVRGNIPRSDAIGLIESALILNGYALIPVDDKTAKILGPSKLAKNESVPLYADPAQLPSTDMVVSYFMPLRFLSAEDAIRIFQQYVQIRPYGSIVPVPNANAIVITENVPLVRRLVALQQFVDVPGAKAVTEFITLLRADAEKVAETLNKLLEAEKGGSTSGGARPVDNSVETPGARAGGAQGGRHANQPPPQGGAGGGISPVVTASTPIQIVPDIRTNRILVVAPESRMPYFRRLIQEMDDAVALEQPLERPLKFISAGDVLPVLKSILTEGSSEQASGADATGNDQTGQSASSSSGIGSGSQGLGSSLGSSSTSGSSGIGSSSGSTGGGSLIGDLQTQTTPLSISVGRTRVIADRASNKIIVIGPPEARIKVSEVLNLLDQRPKQIYLATVIGQLQLGDGIDAGVDYLLKFRSFSSNPLSGMAGATRSGGIDLLPDPSNVVNLIRGITNTTGNDAANTAANAVANAASSAAPFVLGGGLTVFGTIADTLDVYVRLLATSNRFKVISRPVIYTANNKKATIISGQRVPVPQSTIGTVAAGTTNTTALETAIGYQDVVLQVEVLPLVNSDDQVTLEIGQQNNNILGNATISNNQVPIIGTQQLRTTVTVKNRDTVVLGGLITEEKTRDQQGIPILSNIPGLGYLFSRTRKVSNRRELIVMIQPLIVNNQADMAEANHIERSLTAVTHDLYEDTYPSTPQGPPKKLIVERPGTSPAPKGGPRRDRRDIF